MASKKQKQQRSKRKGKAEVRKEPRTVDLGGQGGKQRSRAERRQIAVKNVEGDRGTPAAKIGRGEEEGEEAEGVPMSRQEHFCRLVALEYRTPFEAYCEAFGWSGLPRAGINAAERLIELPEIAERIEALQPFVIEPPAGEDMLTLGEHLRELAQLERIAVRMGQIGAAVNAAIHRGKASGLYVEKSITASVTLEQLIVASRSDGRIEIKEGGKERVLDDAAGAKNSAGQGVSPGPSGLRRLAS